jgi:exodeoxyribonuclease VII small subunit
MEPTLNFEESLALLERAVQELESGELDLDRSLAAYERGVKLLADCRRWLESAERKVALLTGVDADGVAATTPFDASATVDREESRGEATEKRPPKRKNAQRVTEQDEDALPY